MELDFSFRDNDYVTLADVDIMVKSYEQYEEVGCGSYPRFYEEKEILGVVPIDLYKEGEKVEMDNVTESDFEAMLEIMFDVALQAIEEEDFNLL